ncbi:MAG: cation:proton antiporter, partial [Acetobacteraceae bacterium]|nr:cation:proton antiporter [Acetobacteraceae bacterium]
MSLNLVAILLLLAAVFGFVNYRWLRLPAPIGMLIVALMVSGGIILLDRIVPGSPLERWSQNLLQSANLARVFLDVVLAFMLFAGSLHVDLAELRNHKWAVLLLATAGTLLATALFAVGIWVVFLGRVPLVWCVVLGAILAPTDPIAIAGLLRRVGLPFGLAAVIAGESLFNDGVAVVVFGLARGVAEGRSGLVSTQAVGMAFLSEAIGGAALGFVTGYIAYRAMRLIDEYNLELTISLALVTVSYSLAQNIGVSGPIAVVVAGLLIGNQATRFAMSEVARAHVTTFWALVDELLNALLFLLIGLELLAVNFSVASIGAVIGGVLLAVSVR